MSDLIYTQQQYFYESLRFEGQERIDRFNAYWELERSGISGDFLHLSSLEILEIYLNSIKEKYPDGVIEIVWFLRGERYQKLEFMPDTNDYSSLLDVYTHPVSVSTGASICWADIPVCDLTRTDNSGFIQELTGWKPKPMQLTAKVEELIALVKKHAA